MKNFDSLGRFALHLAERVVAERAALEVGLERVAVLIEQTSREEIGVYQSAIGPFPAWEELAESTKDSRVSAGYTENDPLLASGEMRDTFGHEREGLEAVIGSTDEKMIFHEFGTSRMPPRPVFGPAVLRKEKEIVAILGAAAVAGIVGGNIIHPSLGYDRELKDGK